MGSELDRHLRRERLVESTRQVDIGQFTQLSVGIGRLFVALPRDVGLFGVGLGADGDDPVVGAKDLRQLLDICSECAATCRTRIR